MILASIDWLSISINLLLILFVITAVLMSLLILMQRPKQEGLGAAFGSGMTDQMFGARTTNVLQKGTVYLGSMFFILTLTLAILFARKNERGNAGSMVVEETPAEEEVITPAEEEPAEESEETPSLEESLEGQLDPTETETTEEPTERTEPAEEPTEPAEGATDTSDVEEPSIGEPADTTDETAEPPAEEDSSGEAPAVEEEATDEAGATPPADDAGSEEATEQP